MPEGGCFGKDDAAPDIVIYSLKVYERILRDDLKLRKNLTSQEWAAIRSHLAKRKRDGKQASQILLDGRVVNPKRVKKEVRRYQNEDNLTLTLLRGISIRSPTPPSVHEATFQEPSFSSQRIQIAFPLTLSPSGQQPQRHACLTPGRSHSELRLNSPHLRFSLLFREFCKSETLQQPQPTINFCIQGNLQLHITLLFKSPQMLTYFISWREFASLCPIISMTTQNKPISSSS